MFFLVLVLVFFLWLVGDACAVYSFVQLLVIKTVKQKARNVFSHWSVIFVKISERMGL